MPDRRCALSTDHGTDRRAQNTEFRFLRIRDVMAMCGKSRSSIYDAVKKGEFPAPVKLGERTSAWVLSEILSWAEGRITTTRSR